MRTSYQRWTSIRNPDNGTWPYDQMYYSRKVCEACTSRNAFEVTVIICNDGPLWGWWNAERDDLSFVWPSRGQVEMCFPQALEWYESQGLGKLVRVKVDKN